MTGPLLTYVLDWWETVATTGQGQSFLPCTPNTGSVHTPYNRLPSEGRFRAFPS